MGQPRPVRMHDELAVAGDDVEISGLADHRLGDVAEHPGMGEAQAAGKNGDQPPILGENRHGQDQHHVRVADVGQERFRNDRLLRAYRILDVLAPEASLPRRPVPVRALGELDALRRKQEDGTVDRGEQAGVACRGSAVRRPTRRCPPRVISLAL